MPVKAYNSLACSALRGNRLTPQPLKGAEQWMAKQRELWERRLDQLDSYLYHLKEQKP